MAVRHGYGKVAGADALVFAYDTGDTRNSYRGEPTENLATDTPSQNGWGGSYSVLDSATKTFQMQLDQAGAATAWRSWYWSVSSYIGSYITISFDFEVLETSGADLLYFVMGQGNTGTYPNFLAGSAEADKVTDSTGVSRHFTWSGVINSAGLVGCTMRMTNGVTNGYIKFKISNVQIEAKDHETPFVNGTRSNTQGLLDLTGTSTIDLSSVNGYNSNAQLEFDGTNDKIDINIDSWIRTVDNVTVEGVVEIPSGVSMGGGPWAILTDHSTNSERDGFWWHMRLGGGYTYFRVEDTVYGERGITFSNPSTFSAGNTYHIATVVGNDGVYVYNNGVQVETYSPPFNWADISSSHTASLTIGRTYPGYWLNALIHNLKLYNRALTAAEVKNNYNNYKGRFNI